MANLKRTDIVSILEHGVLSKIHTQLYDAIMEDILQEFKQKAEPIVKEKVESITLKNLEYFKNYLNFTDEIAVYFKWEG